MYLVDRHGRKYHLSRRNTIVGRSSQCDITLNSEKISRQHAQLQVRGGAVTITDLGSRNHTFVNGGRVTTPHTLTPGDIINFGGAVQLRFQGGGAERATVAGEPYAPALPPVPQAPRYPEYQDYPAPPRGGTKSRAAALLLEFLLLGLGWMYVGESDKGVVFLLLGIGLYFGDLVVVPLSLGLCCAITIPAQIGLLIISLVQLSNYMNRRPNYFV